MHLKRYIGPAFSYGWQGGPGFRTDIEDMVNGYEKRNGGWSQGRHAFRLGFQQLSPEAFRTIKDHHGICRGMLHAFLFQDGMDPVAVDEPFGVGDGATETFQLSKLSVGDGQEYRRIVTALYAPAGDGDASPVTPVVTADGDPTTAFTVDRDRGLITFDSAPSPGEVLRWSAPFSLWVRLDSDELKFSYDQPNGIYGELGVIEVKPPRLVS